MQYWIATNGQKEGPMSLDEVKSRNLTRKTLVWYPGLAQWTHADKIPELRTLFDYLPPELPTEDDDETVISKPEEQVKVEPVVVKPQEEPAFTQENTQNNNNNGNSYGNYGTYNNSPQCPPSYLALSIISLICCCLPFGIISLIYSAQVRTVFNQGEYEKAEKYSKNALYWGIGSIVAGVIINTSYFLIFWPW